MSVAHPVRMPQAPRDLRSIESSRASATALGQRTTELSLAARTPQRPRLEAQLNAISAQLPEHLQALRVIGEGGSSIVIEAFHTRLKVNVAVKVLAVRGELADAAQQRMMREAELYARLDDPRVPRVYDVNELPDGTPYVVMEMVPGSSLELLLAQTRCLPVPLALHIARELLLALRSVHARGVLHRDIKPANVILSFPSDGECQVRLVDFGIAKVAALSGPQVVLTQRGALVGTPQYMAPERLTGHEADIASETYGVGVLLYEMLAGEVPFGGHNLGAIMAAVLRDEARPLHELRGDLPADLSALVMRSIARDPSARFATAQSMLDALDLVQHASESREGGSAIRRRPAAEPAVLELEDDDMPAFAAQPAHDTTWRRTLIAMAGVALLVTGWVLFERLQQGVPADAPIAPNGPILQPLPQVAPAVQPLPAPKDNAQPGVPHAVPHDEQQAEPSGAVEDGRGAQRHHRRPRAARDRDSARQPSPSFNYVEPKKRDDLPSNPY